MEGAPPQWDGAMPWRAGRWVVGPVPNTLRFGVPPPEGYRKVERGEGEYKRTGRAPLITGRG